MLERIHHDSIIRPAVVEETSPRYPGWRVVIVCFVTAVFSWAFGFYGQGVYLAELHRLTGWPTSMISTASTAYYLLSAVLVVFVSDAMTRLGPRCFLLVGIACLGVATAIIGWIAAPWQLYADYLLMSFGWAAMGVAAITTLVGMWFSERRGLAVSMGLNGASFGGIIGAPALVAAIDRIGFASTMLLGSVVMAAVLVPMTVAWVGRSPATRAGDAGAGNAVASRADEAVSPGALSGKAGTGFPQKMRPTGAFAWTRRRALRSLAFWTVTAPFALALLAQVGFLVHQIALLEPRMGRALTGVAVAVTAIAAALGRFGLGIVVDRLDQRLVGAASFVSQAAALGVMAKADSPAILLVSCGVFGASVGNVVTLPALIIQREFDAGAFAMLVGFSTAIGQFTYAFGPGLLGLLRDMSGGYAAPLFMCAALEAIAAGIVLIRGPRTFCLRA